MDKLENLRLADILKELDLPCRPTYKMQFQYLNACKITWFSVISPLLNLSWSLKNSVVRIPFLWIASLIFSNISCNDGVPGR